MRVAILTSDWIPPLVQKTADELIASATLELAGVVLVGSGAGLRGRARTLQRRLRRFGVGGALRELVHQRFAAPAPPPSFTPRQGGARKSVAGPSFCEERGLPWTLCRETNSAETRDALRAFDAPIVVTMGAGILRKVLLTDTGLTFINAHAGKLPRFGGMNVCAWQVLQDQPVIGTVHRIERGIDTGAVLTESALQVAGAESLEQLRELAFTQVWALVVPTLESLARGAISFQEQPKEPPAKQWFRMHSQLKVSVEEKLKTGQFRAIQESALAAQSALSVQDGKSPQHDVG